jgi:hypothetical protein
MKRTLRAAIAFALVAVPAVFISAPSGFATAPPPSDSSPLLSQRVGGYEGQWTMHGDAVKESFREDGVEISNGSYGMRSGLGEDDVISFGYVGGYGNPVTGVNYAQLTGQAGPGVTEVRVRSTSGALIRADLADGVWAVVWEAVDDASEYGSATLEFDTPQGTRTVSTDDVDVIAAAQRADDAG